MMDSKTINKYKSRSVAWLKKKATPEFNLFIRNRDRNGDYFTCISCGKPKMIINYAHGSNYHAGHYYPSTVSALKYHEHNVNGQCDHCNNHKHGNQIEYRKRLIQKIGIEAVEELDFIKDYYKRGNFKWDRFSLIEIIEKYKQLNKEYNEKNI